MFHPLEENFKDMKFYFRCRVSDRCHVEPGIYRKSPESEGGFRKFSESEASAEEEEKFENPPEDDGYFL